ncbi:MAG: ACT domain-containing protein [Lachnospiraceae bacterium]|nr:ACT domain-containing protein [Lachnospiraceae bacterium]
MKKTIITVVGKDCVGIIAKVCTYLAENKVNILDISQTIVQDYFNMMMVVDANNSPKENREIAEDLDAIGKEIGVIIKAQHEDIFDMMHRI